MDSSQLCLNVAPKVKLVIGGIFHAGLRSRTIFEASAAATAALAARTKKKRTTKALPSVAICFPQTHSQRFIPQK